MSEKRFYVATLLQLAPVHAGVQASHVTHTIASTYRNNNKWAAQSALYDWMDNHKTLIHLCGGNYGTLKRDYAKLCEHADKILLPYDCFHEDEESLGGLMTGWGVVLREELCNAVKGSEVQDYWKGYLGSSLIPSAYYYFNEDGTYNTYLVDSSEWIIINMVKSKPLAR